MKIEMDSRIVVTEDKLHNGKDYKFDVGQITDFNHNLIANISKRHTSKIDNNPYIASYVLDIFFGKHEDKTFKTKREAENWVFSKMNKQITRYEKENPKSEKESTTTKAIEYWQKHYKGVELHNGRIISDVQPVESKNGWGWIAKVYYTKGEAHLSDTNTFGGKGYKTALEAVRDGAKHIIDTSNKIMLDDKE